MPSDGLPRLVGREPGVKTIGDYELLGRLARGGMAELFLARRFGIEGWNKVVVLKRILPQFGDDPEFLQMFLAEARIVATLEHPNIVHVSDIGKDGDDYFFTMAYVHGTDALRILRAHAEQQRRLPLEHALTIAMGLCSGLHYAHEHVDFEGRPLGIVHRDVSPSNVLVTWDGHVKIIDFGIAKAAAQTMVTRAGMRKGKVSYMAPEQCRTEEVDRRTDVWAIGVVLFELTTLRRLFKGEHEIAVMHQILNGEITAPSSVVPDYPPELEAILMRCLRLDRNERWSTAMELRRALEGFVHAHGLALGEPALAEHLATVFGPEVQRYPWMPSGTPPPVRAPTIHGTQISGPAWPGSGPLLSGPYASWSPPDAPRHERFDATPMTGDGINLSTGAPRKQARVPGAVWIAAVVMLLVGVAGIGMAVARLGSDRDREGEATGAAAASTGPTIEQMLVLVNQATPHLALDYGRRHRLLEELERDPGARARIDVGLQVHLDLLQATQSASPCRVFEESVARLQGGMIELRPSLLGLVTRAPDPACEAAYAKLVHMEGSRGPAPVPAKP